MTRNEDLYQAVLHGKRDETEAAVVAAIEAGASIDDLLQDSMVPAMRQMGEDFESGEAFIPEMLLAARAMDAALSKLQPLLEQHGKEPCGHVAIGTVRGDLHDIGKNLVAMMMRGGGYKVVDLGVDCSVESYLAAAADGAQAVCLSALLTTTMPLMKDVVDAMAQQHPEVRVMIGGAPITRGYADSIGAHGYADTAGGVVPELERLLAT